MAFSPRVVCKHRPDYHSLKHILNSPQFAGKKDEELVLALYDFFTSTEDGTWHFWPVDELQGQPRIRRFTSDPVKLLSNYGWHICGQSAIIMYGLYTTAGFKARQYGAPGHLLCEVYYDDAWHILDVDMWTWFRNDKGAIASAYELANDAHRLIVENTNKSNPCNLPDRSLESYAEMYSKAETDDGNIGNVFPHWSVKSHQLDFYLRPGESVQRSEEYSEYFIFPDEWVGLTKDTAKEWHGHPIERFDPFRKNAGGHWTYAPQLSKAFKDVELGYWSKDGVEQIDSGITGNGHISFRIQSPYIFCAKPSIETGAVVYSDGAQLKVDTSGPVQVKLMLEGKSVDLGTVEGSAELDLTEHMTSRYEGIIVFNLDADAVLKSFAFTSPIMNAPKSLPKLCVGTNVMRVNGGDDYQQQTVPFKEIVDFSPTANPTELWQSAKNVVIKEWAGGWKLLEPKISGEKVEAIYHFNAPEGKQFAWFHALCSVKEGPFGEAKKQASLEWSIDGSNWQSLVQSDINNSKLGWDMSLENDCVLGQNTSDVYLRVVSETGITGVEFYGHIDCSAVASTPIRIEHQWHEGDKACATSIENMESYEVVCGAEPSRHVLTLTGLSQPRDAHA